MDHNNSGHGRRIVVGVDGSDCSKAALKWAITQAHLTQATVEAVAAWQDPMMFGYGVGVGLAPVFLAEDSLQTITEKVLDETIGELAPDADRPVQVTTRVRPGHPATVLLEAAIGAQMLVVGSRGHGTFAGILLGSVSQHCVQHAPCPVVVIPLPTTEIHDQAPTITSTSTP
jgi:nucleotide-binding universal stress UspA family protein